MYNKSIVINTLDNTSFDVIYKGFALAFADYEFQVSYDSFKAMLKRRGFNSALSFAAFDGNEIVSFVLNGIDYYNGILTAYDTGTGTAKEYRNKGLAADVFKFSVPQLKNAGVKQYLLEVLQHNVKAVSLYKKLGFEVVREFYYFFQKKEEIAVGICDSSFSVKEIDIKDYSNISTFWDFVPSWQNSLDSVQRAIDSIVCLGAFDGEELIAYCIFEPSSSDIAQLAVDKQYRRKSAATLLLNEIIKRTKADKIAVVNTDSACGSVTAFLKSKNMSLSGKQFEMIKSL